MAAVEITGWDRYTARFAALPEEAKRVAKAGFRSYVTLVGRYTREQKLSGQSLNRRTGALYRSLRGIVGGDGMEADFVSRKYGLYWHEGMPSMIKPIPPNKYLRFQVGGHWVSVKYVKVAQPLKRPFVAESVRETEQQRFDLVATPIIKAVEGAVQ